MAKRLPLDEIMLAQFSGSEQYYRHALVPDIIFTEGAKYVADEAEAYWLLDEIALAQRFVKAVEIEEFQVWHLTVNSDCTARLSCEDGDGTMVYETQIAFTDFPEPGIRLCFCNGCIHLLSEY